MTERMQNYRLKKAAEGMVQLRLWVPKEHKQFFKEMAKECRPPKPLKVPPRFGRRATDRQIQLAEILAKSKNKAAPTHLYDYHISLSAWIRANAAKSIR